MRIAKEVLETKVFYNYGGYNEKGELVSYVTRNSLKALTAEVDEFTEMDYIMIRAITGIENFMWFTTTETFTETVNILF